jgi:hypothetical protein
MADLRKYKRREGTRIVGVQLDLDTDGFTYRKWGATQSCKVGDWLVLSGDETYTVDREVFARTYSPVGPGVYEKTVEIWAECAATPGSIATHEGRTHYEAGDYLVFENSDREGGYAVAAQRFEELYQPAD